MYTFETYALLYPVHRDSMVSSRQGLSRCTSNVMAMELCSLMKASSPSSDSLAMLEPVSIGDGIFQILTSLNRHATDLTLLIDPLMRYFSPGHSASASTTFWQSSMVVIVTVVEALLCCTL